MSEDIHVHLKAIQTSLGHVDKRRFLSLLRKGFLPSKGSSYRR